jgi:hypothetical protein
VEHLKASLIGQTHVLPTHIRRGWKDLPRTNTIAYYKNSYITAVKRFIILGPVRVDQMSFGKSVFDQNARGQ